MKINYIVIPIATTFAMMLGGHFSRLGMEWYRSSVNLPAITPPSWVFSPVWTVIFILTAVFAVMVWNNFQRTTSFWLIIGLLLVNMILNVLWSYLFFANHMIGAALIDALALTATVYAMMLLACLQSWRVALLLVPYAAWGTFACYLNYLVWMLNK